MRRSMASILCLVLLCASGTLLGQGRGGLASQSEVEKGSRLFGNNCAACHGANGDLIPGADLSAGQLRRATSDEALRRLVLSGIPGTPMPPSQLDGAELNQLVAYIRSMRTFNARGVTPGDAGRGRVVFDAKGNCGSCHRAEGRGSRTAPDLSDIGATRTAESIQRSLLDPTAAMRPINRPVRAFTRDGRVVNGRRLNEDTYTVQLIDDNERLLSLDKADLREYTIQTTSSMPSYKDTLSSAELADLVAYLVSLKGLNRP